jgi:hypothetical protein
LASSCLLLSAPASSFDRTGERITESIAHVSENINSHQAAVGRPIYRVCAVCSTWEENKRIVEMFPSCQRAEIRGWIARTTSAPSGSVRRWAQAGGLPFLWHADRPRQSPFKTLFTAPLSLA